MIAVDWGTSSLRAFRLGSDGGVLERRHTARGVMQVGPGEFETTLSELVGDWIAAGERRVLLSGMVGSRQGWREVPYLPCPAGPADLARSLAPFRFGSAQVAILPGLTSTDPDGVPEVMRGEEAQIFGALPVSEDSATICLPGSHSKWATVVDGRISGFTTHLTGETFAALRDGTIIGRLMVAGDSDPQAFAAGLERSAQGGGLLHHVFGARTLVLAGRMEGASAASYLSGLLIGHEVRAALATARPAEPVRLIGEPGLCRLYAMALEACGASSSTLETEAAAAGLHRIGQLARWT